MKKTIIGVAIATIAATEDVGAQTLRLNERNIEQIVEAMTLEEKAHLVCGSVQSTTNGWGFVGNTKAYVPGAAAPTFEIDRHGIPFTILADGPAGLRIDPTREGDERTYYCTAFPTGTLLASSWNVENVYNVTKAMADEVKEYGADVLLAPGMNIQRNPLCGRNYEYFSEDPVLSGEIAAAYVNGLQSQGVGACIKHFIANNQETNRDKTNAIISTRALREIYLKPFEIAIRKSNPWSLMTSYNKVNGTYCCEDSALLEGILRKEWGFDGVVMTDWIGTRNTAAEVHAGNDMLMPGNDDQIQAIIEGVSDGTISGKDLDRNVSRILRYVVKTLRYKGYKFSNAPDLKAHAAISREAAADGMVLLKNNGVLPLSPATTKRIALYGNGSYDLVTGGTGSGHVNKAYVSQINEAMASQGFEINSKLANAYTKYIDYAWAQLYNERTMVILGFGREHPFDEMPLSRETMILCEPESDIALLTISRSAGEGKDREIDGDYRLTTQEEQSIKDLCHIYHQAGKRVVVVLNIGGVIDVESWQSYPDAILLAWQPGQEGGNAIADILSGKENPRGKLPMTLAKNYSDYPSSTNFPVPELAVPQPHYGFWAPNKPRTTGKDIDSTRYEEGIFVGYRHFDKHDIAPAYPFGYGLSYTSFEYGKPRLSSTTLKDTIKITVPVTNTGKVFGKEVVQLYVGEDNPKVARPIKELKHFQKIALNPGETKIVTFVVNKNDLEYYSPEEKRWRADRGKYTIYIGCSSEDIFYTLNIYF